jgi:hypothetical protein
MLASSILGILWKLSWETKLGSALVVDKQSGFIGIIQTASTMSSLYHNYIGPQNKNSRMEST